MPVAVSDEEMIEIAVRVLLSDEQDPRALVRLLVAHWPKAEVLQIIHVLAMAAGTVESLMTNDTVRRNAQHCWRMAALVGVDVCMAQRLGLPVVTAADLMAYWLGHDRFFLGG